MPMLYFKGLDKLFFRFVTLAIILFSICSINGFGKEPILEYLFNEDGSYAYSTGSDNTPLVLKTNTGTADLHTEGGFGVSGSLNDRAFDNYSWYEPSSEPGGLAMHEELNSIISELQSVTVQGWFKTDRAPASYVGKTGTHNEATLIRGPFMLVMVNNSNIILRFRVGNNGPTSLPCTILNEWVFFSITYDKTKPTNNINFYVGTKTQPVELVSTHTSEINFRTDLIFGVGALNPGYGMFYGFLDNIRLYGSSTDGSGVLTAEDLELIRANDIILFPDPVASKVEVDSTECIADGEDVVSITVHVVDEIGNALSDLIVTLEGDNDFEPINKVTGSDGKAIFAIRSTKSGIINFTAKVDIGNGIDPIIIEDKVSVEFIQSINLSKSGIIGEIEPVSADGESEYIVKVTLLDYDDQPIDGREVHLIGDLDEFKISESTKITGGEGESPGEVSFAIKTLEAISGKVTATIAPDKEDGESIILELPIEFVGCLLVEGDGEEFSKITEEKIILAQVCLKLR